MNRSRSIRPILTVVLVQVFVALPALSTCVGMDGCTAHGCYCHIHPVPSPATGQAAMASPEMHLHGPHDAMTTPEIRIGRACTDGVTAQGIVSALPPDGLLVRVINAPVTNSALPVLTSEHLSTPPTGGSRSRSGRTARHLLTSLLL